MFKIIASLILSQTLLFGGTFIRTVLNSECLEREWTYSVYLPDNYSDKGTPYSVIYLLHGNGDDENAWEPIFYTVDSLIEHKVIEPVILVTPCGEKKWWVDGNEKIETAVITELIPEIESKYNAGRKRGKRMIAGYSMGGFGALRYGLVYSELFSSCMILSPALYNELPPEGSSSYFCGGFAIRLTR